MPPGCTNTTVIDSRCTMKTTHYAFIALAVCIAVSVSAQQKTGIAVYYDSGVWEEGVLAFEHFLDW